MEKNVALLERYTQVTESAKEYFAEHKTEESSENDMDIVNLIPISIEKVQEWIEAIKEACDAFDGDVISEICEQSKEYIVGQTPLKPLFDEIKAASDEFDFEEAAEKTENLIDKLQ